VKELLHHLDERFLLHASAVHSGDILEEDKARLQLRRKSNEMFEEVIARVGMEVLLDHASLGAIANRREPLARWSTGQDVQPAATKALANVACRKVLDIVANDIFQGDVWMVEGERTKCDLTLVRHHRRAEPGAPEALG